MLVVPLTTHKGTKTSNSQAPWHLVPYARERTETGNARPAAGSVAQPHRQDIPAKAAGLPPQPHRQQVLSVGAHTAKGKKGPHPGALQQGRKIIPSEAQGARKVVSNGCSAQLQKVSTQFFFRMMC